MRGRAAALVIGAAAAFLAATSTASAYVYWADYGAGAGGTGTTIGRANLNVVGKQSPAAGRSMSSGAKVALRLVPKPRGRRR